MFIIISEVTTLIIFIFLFKNRKINFSDFNFMSVDYTNILRGAAIILVILMHSTCDYGLRIFTPLGGIGVSIFLILSGFGISESYKKYGLTDFWRKKFYE